MRGKVLTTKKAQITISAIDALNKHYNDKYADNRPGRKAPVRLVTLMFHNNSIHVLINGKLRETVSQNHIDELPSILK